MAFAAFGIITPVLSIVLSVFMLGLSLGSVAGGKWIRALKARTGLSGAFFYGLAELLIGVGAFAVPILFATGQRLLLGAGETDSFDYLFLSAVVLAVSLFPWCFFMGATFPLMMAYIREDQTQDPKSFSFLYAANVLGAMAGTFLTAVVFIEMFGFNHTLRIAAAGNFFIAAISALLGLRRGRIFHVADESRAANLEMDVPSGSSRTPLIGWILFSTGFCAMAMEVVWTRAFTPVLKTQVYSFALIVFAYLGATFVGSVWYRRNLRDKSVLSSAKLMAILVTAAFIPIVINDYRFVRMSWVGDMHLPSAFLVLASICPFCAALGYLTPSLVDEYAGGDPSRGGAAYALNVAGCIIGPLFASYILLPQMSERLALVLLGAPFMVFYLSGWKALPERLRLISISGAGLILLYSLFFSRTFLDFVAIYSNRTEVRRDYAASVISIDGIKGKSLLVNGMGMTALVNCTKYMAHLPLVLHKEKPQSALVICFGMGTSYRSALSWGIKVTAVELIPDVPKAFGFYHRDASAILQNPNGKIVIDDGRRFLLRSREQFDAVVIDPPPPVEAAGSSLLYSTQMYDLIKQHLKPGGIIQVWYPGGSDQIAAQAVVRSALESFRYVRGFVSIDGWGLHIIASQDPIQIPDVAQLLARMPESAKRDLLEWSTTHDAAKDLATVISREVDLQKIVNTDPTIQITDDDPMNEYFLLRRHGHLHERP